MTETETINPLTEAMIDELLATPQKKRGYTKPVIQAMLANPATVAVNLNVAVPGIEAKNLKQSFIASIEKNFHDEMSNLVVAITGDEGNQVAVLIHTGRHAAQKAAQAKQAANAQNAQ